MNAPRRTQEERRDATREALLTAAVALLAERGLDATSLHEVAERAGVSKGALTHHYESKEALVDAALDRVASRLERAVAGAWDPLAPPLARLRKAAEAMAAMGDAPSTELRVFAALVAAGARDPRLGARAAACAAGLERPFAQGLALTVTELGARPAVAPEATARAVVSAVLGASLRPAPPGEAARFWERALVATIDPFVIEPP